MRQRNTSKSSSTSRQRAEDHLSISSSLDAKALARADTLDGWKVGLAFDVESKEDEEKLRRGEKEDEDDDADEAQRDWDRVLPTEGFVVLEEAFARSGDIMAEDEAPFDGPLPFEADVTILPALSAKHNCQF